MGWAVLKGWRSRRHDNDNKKKANNNTDNDDNNSINIHTLTTINENNSYS